MVTTRSVVALVGIFASVASLGAAERTLRLDPATTTIRFRVKARAHQVLGTMPLVNGELRFDPETGTASGEIVMDPARAETGVQMRDRTMREEVFEVDRYPLLVFRPQRVAGEVPDEGLGRVQLEGTLAIHGSEHALTLPVALEATAEGIRASTTFSIPYVEWGMRNPGNAMLRVSDTVEVKIETSGVLE
jgi:polyisoprenoid-binding protein YceI